MSTLSPPESPSILPLSLTSRRSITLKLNLSTMSSSTGSTSQPPPSNTLLVTNLQNLDIFRPDNLQSLRDLIQETAPVHSWAPLKSFRRIVVSFYDENAAMKVKSIWDGETIMGNKTRVYYGVHTPVDPKNEHLTLPDSGKLFFISPPPSPPCDWESRLEDAPNTMVHADDLAAALQKLRTSAHPTDVNSTPIFDAGDQDATSSNVSGRQRSRSSTLIYHPEDHGTYIDLPCISVEDMTDDTDEANKMQSPSPKPLTHTSRPPLELLN